MLKERVFMKKLSLRTSVMINMFKDEHFKKRGTYGMKGNKERKIIKIKSKMEEEIKKAMTYDKLDNFGKLNQDYLKYENGMMHFKGKVYIPRSLRENIMMENHDTPIAGHPGIIKTQELIKRNYWWPKIHKDIEDYVRGCDSCQRNKISRQSKVTELAPHDIPKEPWELISVNIISPLLSSHGYNVILAIVD